MLDLVADLPGGGVVVPNIHPNNNINNNDGVVPNIPININNNNNNNNNNNTDNIIHTNTINQPPELHDTNSENEEDYALGINQGGDGGINQGGDGGINQGGNGGVLPHADDWDEVQWPLQEEMPLEELVGLAGPWTQLFDHFLWIIVLNAAAICFFAFTPMQLGRLTLIFLGHPPMSFSITVLVGYTLIISFLLVFLSLTSPSASQNALPRRIAAFVGVFFKVITNKILVASFPFFLIIDIIIVFSGVIF